MKADGFLDLIRIQFINACLRGMLIGVSWKVIPAIDAMITIFKIYCRTFRK